MEEAKPVETNQEQDRSISIEEQITAYKHQKDVVILAHYYTDSSVQALADYVGDSYYLSKIAVEVPNKIIVFCGVGFMGESAKLLNSDKIVLMPDVEADCPMAHMASVEKIEAVRKANEDVAVVCYINSTAAIKAASDVCVTSANAVKVVRSLPNKTVYFIPDANLGRFVAAQVPEKRFLFNDGYCHVHTTITAEGVVRTKEKHPESLVLAHPECTPEVLAVADYIGSTSGIIEYATASDQSSFIICTEKGILYKLKQDNPKKRFHFVDGGQVCHNMKRITPQKVLKQLEQMDQAVELDKALSERAGHALDQMLLLAK
ncbi:quinolinate synthase NadA [Fusibacter paucivorans]|uniref:Quinolinate synthase n=1 Tax=Fusibacter paucivorans TaxID=76009 RepID=A0ABS5PJL0_9FIRM|nr:quinolinate synthase NadA [Fusibacter paucivorans]MBS7525325.1 quinolinate synthase NadA [Fusibacter paucivorans]